MTFVALSCPQCGGPLPRQAIWRTVECPHCKAVVTRSAQTVQRADYRAALQRASADGAAAASGARVVVAGNARYALRRPLGIGRHSDVFLGERLGPAAAWATVKLARDDAGPASLRREASSLAALQSLDVAGAAYFRQRLPQPLFAGAAVEAGGDRREALVVRHPVGCWGSLADVARAQPAGIDARHVVWMWRRVLETLAFVHGAGWTHGDLAPEHLLVDPERHGVRIIGWASAAPALGAGASAARERDLQQLAWSMRAVLAGRHDGPPPVPDTVPSPLAALLCSASDDAAWRAGHDAAAVERALGEAASASFGAPRFVPFDPLGAGTSSAPAR